VENKTHSNLHDRAFEWVGENYPELTGKDFDDKLADVINDIAAIDKECDGQG
jgi:hypothetical protein